MKRSITLGAALLLAAGTAMAFHCPKDMKAIDEALAKKPKLTEAQMKDVKAQREEGEKFHKEGKHAESVAVLAKAMKTLGIEAKEEKKDDKKK